MKHSSVPDEKKMEASRLWMEGIPIVQICAITGIGKNTLSGMAFRNRSLFPARGTPIRKLFADSTYDGDPVQRAQEMWMLGATQAEIRREIGVTQSAIHDAVKSHPEMFPPRETVNSAPEPLMVTLPPLASVIVPPPAIRPFVAGVRLPPIIPTPAIADTIEASPIIVFKPRRTRQCCWPLWGNGRPTHEYCNGTSREGRPYCEGHHKIAHARA